MNPQSDLFDQSAQSDRRSPRLAIFDPGLGEPIAVPFGFMDRTNGRCRRLATRCVLVDGVQLVSRGRQMLHCDPDCVSGLGLDRQAGADATRPS